MNFELRTPPYPLNQFIESVLYYDGYQPDHQIERLLPDGSANLIIELNGVNQHVYDNESLQVIKTHRHAWISGMQSGFISIDSGLNASMVIIRFLPQGAYPFLHVPVEELNDLVIEADLVFAQSVAQLRNSIQEATLVEEKFAQIYQWLKARFKPELLPNQVIQYTLNQIHQMPTLEALQNITQSVGYSQKHLIHLFKKYVGFRPKQYQQITRFNLALRQIEQGKFGQLTSLGYDCGYYDQAHFIKEFKKFAGFSPKRFLNAKGEYIHYVPMR